VANTGLATLSKQDDMLSRAGSIRLRAPRRPRVATANDTKTLEALVGFEKRRWGLKLKIGSLLQHALWACTSGLSPYWEHYQQADWKRCQTHRRSRHAPWCCIVSI